MTNELPQSDLQDRVEQLENRLDELANGRTVEDEQGRSWSAADLVGLGFSRREALTALGALAGGAAFSQAIKSSMGVAQAATDSPDVGTSSNPVDLYANHIREANYLVGADIANAGSGTVPTSQGDGTLAMEGISGGGDLTWTEDENSPVSIGETSSYTYNISTTGEQYLIGFKGGNGNGGALQMQVGGDTGTNYQYWSSDGTDTTSADRWELTSDLDDTMGYINLSSSINGTVFSTGSLATAGKKALNGANGDVSNISQFTLIAESFDLGGTEIAVYRSGL